MGNGSVALANASIVGTRSRVGVVADGDPLPNEHHVARGLGRRGYDKGTVTAAAFALTPRDQRKLSVDWVECPHDVPARRNVDGSRFRLRQTLTIHDQLITVLNVGNIRQICRNADCLDVIEVRIRNYPCHSGIVGMKGDHTDLDYQEDLADLANGSLLVPLALQ